MYDTIKFFGTPQQLLDFLRANLQAQSNELLDQAYRENVRPKKQEA